MTEQEKISLQNLSEENSRLSAENSALVESLTAVYYQSFSRKKESVIDHLTVYSKSCIGVSFRSGKEIKIKQASK